MGRGQFSEWDEQCARAPSKVATRSPAWLVPVKLVHEAQDDRASSSPKKRRQTL